MRRYLAGFLTAMSLCAPSMAADSYPSRTITLVAGFAPGGTTDTLARLLANGLTKEMGQTVVVENISGAGGLIGMQHLLKSDPDGYTLLFINTSLAILPHLHPKAGFDPLRDVDPVGIVADVPMVLSVSNKSGIKSLPDLLARMKSKPMEVNFGSAGAGSTAHLAEALFLHLSKTQAELISYRGSGPALADLMSGQVDGVIDQTVTMLPLDKDNRIKAIAVTGEKRLSQAPHLPTFIEGGVPEFDLSIWNGVVAPKGTPPAVIEKLNQAMSAVIDSDEFKQRLDQLAAQAPGEDGRGAGPMRAQVVRDVERIGELVKEAGMYSQH